MKKDYTVLLIQLDGNLASDVSTRCSGHPHKHPFPEDDQSIKLNQENRVIFINLLHCL